MRPGLLLWLLCFVGLTGFQCTREKATPTACYKARLELKGACMNYTIKVLEGNIDPTLIEASWTNPANKITYQNVFGLASVCNFPSDLEQGDEFYFSINPTPNTSCGVCEAYYPTPSKKLHITVWATPCCYD